METDIKVGLEGTAHLALNLSSLGELELTVNLLDTLEGLVKLELSESAAGKKETGGVGSGPVGKTVLDAVAGKLVGVGGSENLVTDNLGSDDLADHLR